jgi:hypothetical protein
MSLSPLISPYRSNIAWVCGIVFSSLVLIMIVSSCCPADYSGNADV